MVEPIAQMLAQAAPVPGLAPDGVLAFVLLDITIILIAARALGALARRVGQPTVVGEIVAGVLLGPTLLGRTVFAWDKPWSYLQCDQSLSVPNGGDPSITACVFPPQARSVLGLLGQIALVLFMFLVGLELDWDLLKGKGRAIASVAFGAVAVPIGLAFLVGPLLYDAKWVGGFGTDAQASESSFTLFVAAMLAVTAFPVMARILQEKGLTQSAMGAVGVAAAAVVTVLMFLSVAVASGVASEQGPSSLAVKFLVAGIYIAVLFLVVRPALGPLGRAYEARGSLSTGVFALILIFLFASAYAAHKIGINVIVGGFLAGAVLPARQGLFRDMAARLSDFTAVILLPIFLAFSGLNTDFTKLGISFLAGVGLFLAAGIVGKWLGGAVFARLGGLSWAEGNVIGILMNCRGLLVLVVGLIGFSQGVISAPMQVAGVVMALVTTMMTGPLFDAFSPRVAAKAPPLPHEAVPASEPPAAFRVLAGLDDLDRAPLVAAAAYELVGERRPAEVVLCRPFDLPAHDELLSGINDEGPEVERSLRALRMLGSLAPPDVSVTRLSFATVDPAADLARIAGERHCDVIVVGGDSSASGLAARRSLRRLLEAAPCDVVLYGVGQLDGVGTAGGPVALVAPADGPARARSAALAQQLAGASGTVETEDGGGDAAGSLVDTSRRARALVVGLAADDLDALVDGPWLSLLAEAGCPVYVVWSPAPRPAAVN